MLQEHWLSEHQLKQMQQLNVQFVARSGMETEISNGIYRGRPFGGVSICWSSDLNQIISPITNYKHKRVVAVKMKQDDVDILLICAYMPFFDSRKREQCMTEAIDAISMIEVLIEEHPGHHVIIGGDLNTELKGSSPFDKMWKDFITKSSFAYCGNIVSGPQYTYRHDSLNQTKMNDHFIVSAHLAGRISNLRILDEGDNSSDHLPLQMNLAVHTQNIGCPEPCVVPESKSLHWDKMTECHKLRYATTLEQQLLQRQFGNPVFACAKNCVCNDSNCHDMIQNEYNEIM